jgi:2-succinyl-5-enolpyruvyl-6-hydroxy-3-cyclohexene-1-carboxylate synthase
MLGDLAFLHDLSGLVAGPAGHPPAVAVVLDNSGGGIFSFLPPATELDKTTFELLFGTPGGVDVAAAAAGLGCEVEEVTLAAELAPALGRALAGVGAGGPGHGRLQVIVARTDRAANVELHGELHAAAAEALSGLDELDELTSVEYGRGEEPEPAG